MNSKNLGAPDERAYWSGQMEAAYAFMMRVRELDFEDCGQPFGDLRQAAEDAGIEARFSQRPYGESMPRLFYLRQGLIEHYLAAAEEMNRHGLVMLVEDAYRTPTMQSTLQRTPVLFDRLLETVLWETDGDVPDAEFVFRRLLAMIAFCPRVGTHVSGSALDITVLDRNTGEEIDCGGPYLTFDVRTPMRSPFITPLAQANRAKITAIMRNHGFIDYPFEFWHYSRQDAYDTVLSESPVTPIYGPVQWQPGQQLHGVEDPAEPLNSVAEIQSMIDGSFQRRDILRSVRGTS